MLNVVYFVYGGDGYSSRWALSALASGVIMRFRLSTLFAAVSFVALFLGLGQHFELGTATYFVPLIIAALVSGLGYRVGRLILAPAVGVLIGGLLGGPLLPYLGLLVGLLIDGLMWRELWRT